MGGNEPLLGLHPTQDPHIAGAEGGGGGGGVARGVSGGLWAEIRPGGCICQVLLNHSISFATLFSLGFVL